MAAAADSRKRKRKKETLKENNSILNSRSIRSPKDFQSKSNKVKPTIKRKKNNILRTCA